jgi:ankyrin repeat protein
MFMYELPEPYQRLFMAILHDSGAEISSAILHQGACVNYIDPSCGRTPLYTACVSNKTSAINILLEHGADPNQRFTYRSPVDHRVEADVTALHYASSPEAVISLIQAGAEVNAVSAIGTTPLMRAAFCGKIHVVKVLLKVGASPYVRQKKCRSREALTARELAESKIEFWRTLLPQPNREQVEHRILCYEEIRDLLLEAERESSAGSE